MKSVQKLWALCRKTPSRDDDRAALGTHRIREQPDGGCCLHLGGIAVLFKKIREVKKKVLNNEHTLLGTCSEMDWNLIWGEEGMLLKF